MIAFQPSIVLFISVIEIFCYSRYLVPIPKRWAEMKYALYLFFSILLLTLINLVFYQHLGYLTALMYYSFVLGWILAGYQINIKIAVFDLLIFFMSGHCLKQIFGNLAAASFCQVMNTNAYQIRAFIFQILLWVVFGLILTSILVKIRDQIRTMDLQRLTWNRIFLMLPAVIPVLYISYMTIFLNRDPTPTELIIEAVSSFCGLILIISQERAHLASLYQLEISQLENAMRSQYERYLVSSETAEKVNQACHDLKNQMIAFRMGTCVSEEEVYIREIEKTIHKYRTVYHTDNGVLDGLLFEKGRQAEAVRTQLVCFADGSLLAHIRPVDLCTLIGNLLDNAIEACVQLDESDSRTVILKVTQFRQFALIRCENPYSGNLLMDGFSFISTKQEQQAHGYGLKGIRHVVQEYNGEMDIETDSGRFVISILIPLSENDSSN